jgi:hypothetical protein
VTVVILSAVVPTLIATRFFEPEPASDEAFEDLEAAEGDRRRAPAGAPARRATGPDIDVGLTVQHHR